MKLLPLFTTLAVLTLTSAQTGFPVMPECGEGAQLVYWTDWVDETILDNVMVTVEGTNGPYEIDPGHTLNGYVGKTNTSGEPEINVVFEGLDVNDDMGDYWYLIDGAFIGSWDAQGMEPFKWDSVEFRAGASTDSLETTFHTSIHVHTTGEPMCWPNAFPCDPPTLTSNVPGAIPNYVYRWCECGDRFNDRTALARYNNTFSPAEIGPGGRWVVGLKSVDAQENFNESLGLAQVKLCRLPKTAPPDSDDGDDNDDNAALLTPVQLGAVIGAVALIGGLVVVRQRHGGSSLLNDGSSDGASVQKPLATRQPRAGPKKSRSKPASGHKSPRKLSKAPGGTSGGVNGVSTIPISHFRDQNNRNTLASVATTTSDMAPSF